MSYYEYREIEDDEEILEDILAHYGVSKKNGAPGRGSGRYELGSGENPQSPNNMLGNLVEWDDDGGDPSLFDDYMSSNIGRMRGSRIRTPLSPKNLGRGSRMRGGAYYRNAIENTPEAYMAFYSEVKDLKEKTPGITDSQLATHFNIEIKGKPSPTTFKSLYSVARDSVNMTKLNTVLDEINSGQSKSAVARAHPDWFPAGESAVRSFLTSKFATEGSSVTRSAQLLEDELKKHKYLDVSEGTELSLGISQSNMERAIMYLQQTGNYNVYNIRVSQGQNDQDKQVIKTLAPKDSTFEEVQNNRDKIDPVGFYYDPNSGVREIEKPKVIDHNRIYINYTHEDGTGGVEEDGTLYIKPGVKDLNIGCATQAQVRIAIDDEKGDPKYYVKAMARYAIDGEIPDGYDAVINTNKKDGAPLSKVYKELKKIPGTDEIDWEMPFGASIKDESKLKMVQKHYFDDDGKEQLNAVNVVREEGDWDAYRVSLPAQFWSKQNLKTVKKQLDMTYDGYKKDLDEIMAIKNPHLRQYYLDEFASQCDTEMGEMRAVGFADQSSKVLMPVTTMKSTECYCPTLPNGEKVALVRFPHQYPGEIPILTVNNKEEKARASLKYTRDAIGINQEVAMMLSGADFDGDHVITIPIRTNDIKTQKALEGLAGYEPKDLYKVPDALQMDRAAMEKACTLLAKRMKVGEYDHDKYKSPPTDREIADEVERLRRKFIAQARKDGKIVPISKKEMGKQMGVATNLVADMGVQINSKDSKFDPAETVEDMTNAIKYAQLIIDAEKHYLDYKQAYKDFHIEDLKRKYQPKGEEGKYGGARTLITKADAEVRIPEREEIGATRKLTQDMVKAGKITQEQYDRWVNGEHVYRETGRTIKKWDKDVKEKVDTGDLALSNVKGITTVKSAHELSLGYDIEEVAADFSDSIRELGNKARSESRKMVLPNKDPLKAMAYPDEVESLEAKLEKALRNAPLERKAKAIADLEFETMKRDHPEWTKADQKKYRNKILERARKKVGSHRETIEITDAELVAIDANVLPSTKVKQLFRYADQDQLRQKSMPRKDKLAMTQAQINYALALLSRPNPGTPAEIAEQVGVSVNAINSLRS